MSTPPVDPPPPERIGNRYRIGERIGAGAMGAVWLGTDELLNRPVAIKELLAAAVRPTREGVDGVEESRQRLMREGRIGARLQHPHVISMFDVVVHDERPWLIMEYLPSQSLAAILSAKGPMEPREAAEMGRQVADGLAAAHKAGVVHRDVKPGNVLMAEDGRVKLTDFGVSRAVDDVQLTRTGLIAGTPAFLAPEIARGHEPAAPSDVFALGSTLYAAVEGVPPFGLDENAYALLHKVATGEIDPPQQAGELEPILFKLLAPDPADRPSASQARDMLTRIAAGRGAPVAASATATKVAMAPASPRKPARVAATPAAAAATDGGGSGPTTVASGPAVRETGDAPRRRWPIILFIVLALLLVGGGVTAAILANQASQTQQPPASAPVDPTADPAAPTEAPATTTEAAATTTTVPPTTTVSAPPTEAPPPPDAGVVTDPVSFVTNYYGLLPGSPDAAWALLGPTAQGQSSSAGKPGYDNFWAGISSVSFTNASADGNTVRGTVNFVGTDGSTSSERYTLVVGQQNGATVIESFSQGG